MEWSNGCGFIVGNSSLGKGFEVSKYCAISIAFSALGLWQRMWALSGSPAPAAMPAACCPCLPAMTDSYLLETISPFLSLWNHSPGKLSPLNCLGHAILSQQGESNCYLEQDRGCIISGGLHYRVRLQNLTYTNLPLSQWLQALIS